MGKSRTFNCELKTGDRTMYGLVRAVERISDAKVKVTVHGGQFGQGERVVYLDAAGTTNVRWGKDAREVGL